MRLQCVRALQGLYQEKEFIGRLELFTNRFKVRHPSGRTLASFNAWFFPLFFQTVCLPVCLSQHLSLIYCFSFLSCFHFVACLCLPSHFFCAHPPYISMPFQFFFFHHSCLLLWSHPLSGHVSGCANCCQLLIDNKPFSNTCAAADR